MTLSVRHKSQVIGLILAAITLHCQQPIEPDSADSQRGLEISGTSADQVPEEEILGSVSPARSRSLPRRASTPSA